MKVQEIKDYLDTLPQNYEIQVNGKEINGLNVNFEDRIISLSVKDGEC